jgi:hypothetical protein
MNLRTLLCMLVVFGEACWPQPTSPEQLRIAEDTRIGAEWTVLELPASLPMAHSRNELFLEVPTLSDDRSSSEIRLKTGEVLRVEASMLHPERGWIALDLVDSIGLGARDFVVASNKALRSRDSSEKPPAITRIRFRSTPSISVRKISWLSYEPSHVKGGIAYPN